MVKADPKRDYYHDLDLLPNAESDDIRKQYRKLALKWHPDRNPGREGECLPRFQAIQAANEVLGDPHERLRYDIERKKKSNTPNLHAPTRGRAAPSRAEPTRDKASASRFQKSTRPTGQTATNFNAWCNIKPSKGADPVRDTNNKKSSSSSTRPRQYGFDPNTPGADERPARPNMSSYFTATNRRRPVPPPPPPPRDPPPAAAAATRSCTSPLSANQSRQPEEQASGSIYPEGMRTRTPYNAYGGEKISVDPARRSTDQQSSPRPDRESVNPHPNPATSARRRSASPQRHDTHASATHSSSEDGEPPDHASRPTDTDAGTARNTEPPIFSFSPVPPLFAKNNGQDPKPKVANGTNTTFSPEDWDGEFVDNSHFFTAPAPPSTARPRRSPTRPVGPSSSTQPFTFTAGSQKSQPPSQPPSIPTKNSATLHPTTAAGSGPAKFSPSVWHNTFNETPTPLGVPPGPPKATPPANDPIQMRGRKQSRPRATGTNVKPKPATVADANDSSEAVESAHEVAEADGNAMDIDPPPAVPPIPQPPPLPLRPQTNGARRPKITPKSISRARPAQRWEFPANAPANPRHTSNPLDFNKFMNVPPFSSTSQEGLNDLTDLSRDLPFASRPAETLPFTRPSKPTTPGLPPFPSAPDMPKRLTPEHAEKMTAYSSDFLRSAAQTVEHVRACLEKTAEVLDHSTFGTIATDSTDTGNLHDFFQRVVGSGDLIYRLHCEFKSYQDAITKPLEGTRTNGQQFHLPT